MKKDDGMAKCLLPICDRDSQTRGLCHGHYMTAKYFVDKKETTWKKLEAKKKCLPKKSLTGESRKWFLDK